MRALFVITLLFVAASGAGQESLGLDGPRLAETPKGSPLAGEALERRAHEVASGVRCPVCQGLSVADSPTESAQAIKRELRDLLEVGYSEDQVLGYLERSYGEFIRLAPKPTGFNLVVWLAPIAALIAGLLLIARRLRSSHGAAGAAAGVDPELAPYLERVRRETRG